MALVIDHFLPAKGGAERSLERILTALRARGHSLQLWTMSCGSQAVPDLDVHRVSTPPLPRGFRDWFFARASERLLARLSPDVVLGVRHVARADVFLARGGFYAQTLEANGRAAGGLWKRVPPSLSLKHRILLRMEKRLLEVSPGHKRPLVIAPSDLVRRYGEARYRLPPDRVVVIQTGADLDRFEPASAVARTALRVKYGADDRVVGLFAAHNFRLKGLPCLLNAWKKLPPNRFLLLIAGHGTWSPRWSAPGVKFVGAQPDLVELYQLADFLVHPTFYDPFSRVVIEAMACGLPAITTRFNGAAEIIRDGVDGFLIDDPRESEALADRMARFSDAKLRAAFASAARQQAELHPEDTFLTETAKRIEREGAAKVSSPSRLPASPLN